MKYSWFLYFLFLFCDIALCQRAKNASVELWATLQKNPFVITIHWIPDNTGNYTVYKRLKESETWELLSDSLTNTSNCYIDDKVEVAKSYEYRVQKKIIMDGILYEFRGYINSGIEIPTTESRGKILLMIADNFEVVLVNEIDRLVEDLEGDGWEVLLSYVNTSNSVEEIKEMIKSTRSLEDKKIKALFLLGHIPIPYSGNFSPDEHEDHVGAWPADAFYGVFEGNWTDTSETTGVQTLESNKNIPGDGRFDNSFLPGDVELQIGRVDFYGMTMFKETEIQLTKSYLDKNHQYRNKGFQVIKKAIVRDGFPNSDEPFASNGYRNFGVLVGPSNVLTCENYFNELDGKNFQWSYACGPGHEHGARGVGKTIDYVNSNLNNVFSILFGSYFGDWNTDNNFLRAPLGQGKTLVSFWGGRPDWFLQHMALGETVGYSTQFTQNYVSDCTNDFPDFSRGVHIALMGDPTLRNDVVAPVSTIEIKKGRNKYKIVWKMPDSSAVIGYNIYRKSEIENSYVKLNEKAVVKTKYIDKRISYDKNYKYMIRVINLESTPSGTYYNMSTGKTMITKTTSFSNE